MSHHGLTLRHRSPNRRAIRRSFGYYSPRYAPFHPIYEVNELAFSSHCPRKALFLHRRGDFLSWDCNYKRPTNTQQSPQYFQNSKWYKHSQLYTKTIVELLSELGGNHNNLQNFPINSPQWRDAIRTIIENDIEIENASSTLVNDIMTFFSRWNSEGKLDSYFQHSELIAFNHQIFNPSITLEEDEGEDPNRGKFVGSFPVIGSAHIINFYDKEIVEIVCHHDTWLQDKDPVKYNNTNLEDNSNRRDFIVWRPYYFKLFILKKALSQLKENVLRGILLGNTRFGRVPEEIENIISFNNWENEVNQFNLEVAGIEESRYIDSTTDYSRNIIDGLLSSIKAYVGHRYALSIGDSNPCYASDERFSDPHCSMFKVCSKKSISYILGSAYREIARTEERVYHERVLTSNLDLYRLAEYLPEEPILLNQTHVSFWCGTIIQQTPLVIELDQNIFVDGLSRGTEYTISNWSPFFGRIQIYQLSNIEEENNAIQLQFDRVSTLPIGNKVVILNPTKSDNNLRREQSALNFHLYSKHQTEQDLSTVEGQQEMLLKILEEGGRRTGQAIFGGWSEFQ